MHDIDFLPAEYRQSHAERTWQGRRLLIVALLAALVAAAALGQHRRRHRLAADLARCKPEHAKAAQIRDALTQLQSRLQVARTSADLYTYLRHPWPRTRIIAALLEPLPEEIAFEELRIERSAPTGRASRENVSRLDEKAEQEQLARLLPAARDLKGLRDEFDAERIVVTISGVTSESAALHRYLGLLDRKGVFSKVRFGSTETDTVDRRKIRFNATLIVRPGYGQPGGPTGPDQKLAGETRQKTT
jgi:Tfp pilus assembly protein PilN